jgi:hypothetical protein
LPCYQERAASGYFPTAGEPDICLEEERLQTAAANPPAVDQPQGEKPQSARILNDVFQ